MAQNALEGLPVVVIGGSAGSLDVLLSVLPLLNPHLSAAIIIVLHRKVNAESPLVSLLSAKTKLPVSEVEEKQKIRKAHIYLAPADYHLLIEHDETFSLDYSEKINFSRPSIDVTFETAAEVFGTRATGILLSGANADGVAGLHRIRETGGTTIVQSPETAEVAYMPNEAIKSGITELILSPEEILHYINKYASR